MGTWPIEAWMRKSGVLLTKRSLALMVKRELHLLQKRMVPWVVGTTLKRSITESTTRTQKTKDQMSLSEEWTRKSMVSLLTLFPHLTPLSEALLHSCQMVLMNLLSRVLHSTREDTTTNITREILLREVWMRKSMVSLLTPFHHSTPESEAPCHSFQMALTHLPIPQLAILPLRESITTNITREILLREVWMRKSTVSVPTPFHHSTPDLEANCHSFQTALTHQPTHHLANPTLPLRADTTADITRDQISMREEWTRKSMVSLPTLFHHSTAGKEALNHSFQMVPTHLLMIATSWQEDIETLPREVWTLMFGDSPLRPFHQ